METRNEDGTFKKGVSGNPNGRAKGQVTRKTIIKKWLEAEENTEHPLTGEMGRFSQYDLIVLTMLREARKGNVSAFKEMFDGVFGKIPNEQEITLKEEINVEEIKASDLKL